MQIFDRKQDSVYFHAALLQLLNRKDVLSNLSLLVVIASIASHFHGHSWQRMWDMSTLIWRCENFGLFYSLSSELVEASEHQTKA